MRHDAVLALTWVAWFLILMLLLTGCAEPDVPTVPRVPRSATWVLQPMTGGPSVYVACVNGTWLYALQPLASRMTDGLWPGASIAAHGRC